MPDSAVLLIVILIALSAGGVALRYALRNVVYKGTDAIGNARRRNKNAANGAEVVRLADLYPEIAQWHRQNGTAYEAAPVTPAVPVTPVAPAAPVQQNIYMQQNTYAQPGYTNRNPVAMSGNAVQYYGNAAPNYGYGAPNYGYAVPAKKGNPPAVIALVFTAIGLLINAVLLVLGDVSLYVPFADDADPEVLVYLRSGRVYTILFLLSVAAYIVLLVTRKTICTVFYPVMMIVLGIVSFFIANARLADIKAERDVESLFDYPRYIVLSTAFVWLFLVFAVLGGCFELLHLLKGYRWAAWAGLVCGTVAVLAFVPAGVELGLGNFDNVLVMGNYFGYTLLIPFYALAYGRKKQ